MTHAGVIGMTCVGAFAIATIILALARLRWVHWCPACRGSGRERSENRTRACTACGGRGILRVPDSPAALMHGERLDRPKRRPRQ